MNVQRQLFSPCAVSDGLSASSSATGVGRIPVPESLGLKSQCYGFLDLFLELHKLEFSGTAGGAL